jgi:outer membrane protein
VATHGNWKMCKLLGICGQYRLRLQQFHLTDVAILLFIVLITAPASVAQAPQPVRPDYSVTPKWFPQVLSPYKPRRLAPADVTNSKSLSQMIQDGKLELSLAQLAAAVVENNLSLAVDRYYNYSAQADLLRAKGGQAARGVDPVGATIPDALFSAAIGAGVGNVAGLGGIGVTGSISGLTRTLTIQPRGAYDPAFIFNVSWDRTASPLNTLVVAGSPVVTTDTAFYQFGWQQAFTSGTSFSLQVSNQRQYSTQQALIYDPAVITRMSLNVVQQLTNGFGFTVNRRFQIVARNDIKIARNWFLQQVNTTLAQAEDSYWDLVSAQEQVKAMQETLEAAQQLYEDNRKQERAGTLAPLDVLAAQAQVASAQRDLIVAQSNFQQQELALKMFFSKEITDALGDAQIVATDPLPNPQESDIPPLDEAMSTSERNRPEVSQAQATVMNDQLAVKVTQNFLKPTLNAFGLFASAGLDGDQMITIPGGPPILLNGGLGQELNQFINFRYPEYAFGFSLTIPIKNRSALADNARASLLERQAEISFQRTQSTIGMEVRSAGIKLMQAKAETTAADSVVDFSRESLDAEQKKRAAGLSTPYNVILAQRNLLDAQLTEVQARVTYAKALVEMERSMGVLLDESHIDVEGALQGQIVR